MKLDKWMYYVVIQGISEKCFGNDHMHCLKSLKIILPCVTKSLFFP